MKRSWINSGELSFVDPSATPPIFWSASGYLAKLGFDRLVEQGIEEVLNGLKRYYLSVEYAVGFDGVDDYVELESMEILSKGFELETEIWIPKNTEERTIVSIENDEGETVFVLKTVSDDGLRLKAFYNTGENLKQARSTV